MLKMIRRAVFAVALMAAFAVPASAQFSFGVKAGVAVSDMKFNKDVFDASNRAGFTGGIMAEVMIPMTNVGVDASLMYVRRNTEFMVDVLGETESAKSHRDYIEIPVNFKWKIGLPVVGSIVSPYIFTGPSFAFLTSKKEIEDAYKNKTFDVSWNIGVGVQLIKKLQIGASYGFGLTKAVEMATDVNGAGIEGKNRYWTITAAYLF